MKQKYIVVFAGLLLMLSRGAVAVSTGHSRVSSLGPSARIAKPAGSGVNKSSVKLGVESVVEAQVKDTRQKEKEACIGNSIGLGNSFVWASKYSNVLNYSSMIEDVDNPENNVCFVRVELKSHDPKIDVSDFGAKYFQMGSQITCGSWVGSDVLEKRILDAKKSVRIGATIGATVGGAALGVGAMEAFGNKLIGGAVQGQKALSGSQLLISQLNVLKKDNPSEYNKIVSTFKDLKRECDKTTLPDAKTLCIKYDYDVILSGVGIK